MSTRRFVTGIAAAVVATAAVGVAVSALAAADFAPAAQAAPTIGSVRSAVVGTKLSVEIDATVRKQGTIRVEGTANGRRVRLRKKVGGGSHTVALVVDPRRSRLRRVTGPVVFDLTASVQEKGSPRAERPLQARIGVPLIVLPGLGNEQSPGGFDLFGTALDNASGGAYGFGGTSSLLVVHEYESLTKPLPGLAKDLDRAAKKLLKGSVFSKVDVVGYSMGGLVARKWMAGAGKGRVRKLVFLGTPNEGAPIAFLAGFAARTGILDTLLANAGGGALTGALDTVFNDQTAGALDNFTPTYDWATYTLPFVGTIPVDLPTLLALFGGDTGATTTPLETLNATPPDPKADFHAVYYSSVPTEAFGIAVGTIDVVDLTPILPALKPGSTPDLSGVDLAALASGSGDGIVPAHSVTMDEVPAWSQRITKHDLGAGTHVTFTLDPQVYATVSSVLNQ